MVPHKMGGEPNVNDLLDISDGALHDYVMHTSLIPSLTEESDHWSRLCKWRYVDIVTYDFTYW